MALSAILSVIDAHISQLQQARQLLSGSEVATGSAALPAKQRGRPPAIRKEEAKPAGKRTMSEEARARIAAAQKKRWAKSRKAAKAAPPIVAEKKAAAPAKKVALKKAAMPAKKTVLVKVAAKRAAAPARKAPGLVKKSSRGKAAQVIEPVEPTETLVSVSPAEEGTAA